MNIRTKIKLVRMAARGAEVFIVLHDPKSHEGVVSYEEDGDTYGNIYKIIISAMEFEPDVRNVVLDAARDYLKKYEVDGKNFCKEVFNK